MFTLIVKIQLTVQSKPEYWQQDRNGDPINALGASVILSMRLNLGAPAQLHYLPKYRLSGSVGPGVAFDLSDGSLFMECAAMETHGSTPVENARKNSPERVGIVCFTHACLNKPHHGHLTTPAK